jgi:hypothetical protein
MRIEMLPTVSFDDIKTQFHYSFDDVTFTQMAENGSYVSFDLTKEHLAELLEEIADLEEWGEVYMRRYHRLHNEVALIRYFNSLGYNDVMLIYISW